MSRSYRAPWFIDGYGSKWKVFAANQANRRIRRTKDVPDHKAYKKFYQQYDICDYKYQYDSKPSTYHWGGEIHYFEADPRWKAVRK